MAVKQDIPQRAPEQAVRRILVVDDDLDFADSLVDILGLCSYEVEVAHSAREACDKARAFDARVALLDIRLGKSNGLDLIDALQAIRPGLLCVVMTAYSGATSSVEAIEAGAYDYLGKPLAAGDLLATLERCFQSVRLRDEKEKIETALRLRSRELERTSNRLDGVLDAADRLVEELDFERPGECILNEFARVFSAKGGSLFLLEGSELRCVAAIDSGHACRAVAFPPSPDTVFGRVVESRCPLLVQDIAAQDNLRGSGWDGYHDGSLIAFPLTAFESGQIRGILALHNRENPPFSDLDLRLGRVLLALAAQALSLVDATLARRQSDLRFRTVVRASKLGMVLISGQCAIDLFNPAAEAIFGRREEEVLGACLCDLLSGSEVEEMRGAIEQYFATGDPSHVHGEHFEAGVRHPDERQVPIEIDLSVGEDQRKRHVLAIFRETSSEKSLERQLSRAQKMQVLGQLAGGVAHDFNNLLQAIIAHSQLAMMDLEAGGERASHDLHDILVAAQRAATLTRQLLTFSRRENADPVKIDLNRLIAEMTKMLTRLMDADIEFVTELHPEPCVILADAAQIEQVLMNLCLNARDAMPRGGRICVETAPADIDAEYAEQNDWARPGEYVRLRVIDSGEGISQEDLAHIFEPFFSTKGDGKGTGLGLAIVYDAVKRHDGLVNIRSAAARGTTFDVYLPRIATKPDERHAEHAASGPGGHETILVAEDDAIVRDLTVRILTKAGYRVLTAENGAEAIAIYDERAADIDMALLDAVMPKRNGREVYEHIRAHCPEFPVLFCSGYSGATLQTEFIANEGLVLLAKPYAAGELLLAVRRILETGRLGGS